MKELKQLIKYDTPTICNALEMVDKNRKNFGYTSRGFMPINTENSPVAGFAKTSTMRSLHPSSLSVAVLKELRVKYYRYINDGDFPKICVMQDIDGEDAGRGPFWGECNVRIHKALGAVGIITNGSIRDVTHLPNDILILGGGLRPSHSNVHVVDFDVEVNVNGMIVSSGDIIHADIHGAVCFSSSLVFEVIKAANEFQKTESRVLEGYKKKNVSIEEIIALYLSR